MAKKRFQQTPAHAPTRDYDTANKKYVDDKFPPTGSGVTGSGTSGKITKWTSASAIGNGTNTDTEVASAVTKSHDAATAGSGISVTGQQVANTDKGTDARTAHELAYEHTTSMASITMGLDADKPASGWTGKRFYFATDTAILYVDTGAAWVSVKGVFA